MDEYYLHEQVLVCNPTTLLWQHGKIVGKFYDFTDPDNGHVYSVELNNGDVLQDIYCDVLTKVSSYWGAKKCECGGKMMKHPGHSSWCPKFKEN